ncbi:6-hydroxymethylpterin diphosphokinase MptE-like protein [Bacillus sp. CGMCC 1.16607]
MKILKDKHKGERCFIVATGPSLVIEDLDKLRNEMTFSMNSIFLSFNETDWRPNYYGIQFPEFFHKYKNEIDQLNVELKLVGDVVSKQVKLSDDYYIYPLHMLNHNWTHKKYHSKFSADAFEVVYSGYTITYSLIQLAVYMGFEEIYLIGVDCNYASNKNNHVKDYGIVDPLASAAGEKMICAFKEAKKYADNHQIKIYNATRGGMLEVFERVDFDSLFLKDKAVNIN